MRELRIDIITNDMVIFAEDRIYRPIDKINIDKKDYITEEYKENCPFCRNNEILSDEETFRIEKNDSWVTRSVLNKFPILNDTNKNFCGRHEVIIDTYKHSSNFYNFSQEEFKDLFTTYKKRYINLNDGSIKYVSIFKNYMRESGASLSHPHSQIISLPIVPKEIKNEVEIAKEYYEENKVSLYDKLIQDEINNKDRVVYNGDLYLVLVPYASKYGGEVRILFKDNIDFGEIEEKNIDELAYIFKKLFTNLYKVNGNEPFNLCIHTHPKIDGIKKYYNTHMHIIPRKYNFGGFELGTGVYVSSKNPEELTKNIKFT